MSAKGIRVRSSEPEVIIAAILKAEPGSTITGDNCFVIIGTKLITPRIASKLNPI